MDTAAESVKGKGKCEKQYQQMKRDINLGWGEGYSDPII